MLFIALSAAWFAFVREVQVDVMPSMGFAFARAFGVSVGFGLSDRTAWLSLTY